MARSMRPLLVPAEAREVEHGPAFTFSVIVAAYQAADVIGEALDSVADADARAARGDRLRRRLHRRPRAGARPVSRRDRLPPQGQRRRGLGEERRGRLRARRLRRDPRRRRHLPARAARGARRAGAATVPTSTSSPPTRYLVVDGAAVRRNYDRDAGASRSPTSGARSCSETSSLGTPPSGGRASCEHGGFDESILWTTDWDLWLRLILAGSPRGPRRRAARPLPPARDEPHGPAARPPLGKLATLEKARGNPQLRDEERTVLEAAIAAYRRDLSLMDLRSAVSAGEAGVRRRALALLPASGLPPRRRLEAAAIAAAPGVAGRLLRRRHARSWVGAGGTRVERV